MLNETYQHINSYFLNCIKDSKNIDPAAGSGSLFIHAADECPIDENGDSIVTIFGQEKYPDTPGLAKMNFILHNKSIVEINNSFMNNILKSKSLFILK